MNEDEIQLVFREMIEAVDDMDDDRVIDLYSRLKVNGHSLSVKTSETTRWKAVDGIRYATVLQESLLVAGDLVLCRWSGEYAGSYGCMGTGWWVDRVDDGENDIDPSISELLEICEIYLEDPQVPEPLSDQAADK